MPDWRNEADKAADRSAASWRTAEAWFVAALLVAGAASAIWQVFAG